MSLTRKHYLGGAILLAAGLGLYLFLQGKTGSDRSKPRSSVQVVKSGLAEQRSMQVILNANGYVTALNTVDVRPQLQNIVRAIHVREGQDVRAGQLLFTLDERNDASNVAKSQAQVARDRADLTDAEANLKRNQELLAKNFVSQAVVDTARNRVDAARSMLKADQAAVASSSVALGYNRITASISGRLGAISVHPGSLAQPSGAPLVTIAQLDPIAVSFAVPERELAYIRASYPNGDAPVVVEAADAPPLTGTLFFIDNTTDAQSGTIKMKARFANADRKLWPGAFVNVRLVSRTLPAATVIPAQAIVTGPVDKFVYLVQADDTVKMQKIDVVNIDNGQAAVTGLKAGTRIVIEGAQNLRPGVKVREMQVDQRRSGTDQQGAENRTAQ